MNQDKISSFIKQIRKDNNLTQKQLADRLGVTYQAVSKWENGINLPDISILKQISDEFNISIDELLEGNYNKKGLSKLFLIIPIIIIILGISYLVLNTSKYQFKTISTTCTEFEVSGSIAYDNNTSSIYISHVNYCGGNDDNIYQEIECNLYENNDDTIKKISSCKSNETDIKLEDYLKDVKLNIDNYAKTCKNYNDTSLFLEINAKDKNNNTKTYKIPLNLNNNCPSN